MTDLDNQGVGEDPATPGQNQETTILGGELTSEEINTAGDGHWMDNLPDDLKKAPSLEAFSGKELEDLVRSYVNAQSVIGRRFEDLTDEQIKHYYGVMGRPESPEGYNLEAPEGVEINQEVTDWYKKTAHELDLDKDKASALYKSFLEFESEIVGKQQQLAEIQAEEDFKALKKDFGPAFDERVELANRALREFGGEEAIALFKEKGLSNNPAIVKMLANAGMTLAEGKFTEGNNTGKFGMTSEEASGQISVLRKDPEFMKHYNDPSSSKHKEALKKMEDLYKIKVNATG